MTKRHDYRCNPGDGVCRCEPCICVCDDCKGGGCCYV
jgi:hypothetical protein